MCLTAYSNIISQWTEGYKNIVGRPIEASLESLIDICISSKENVLLNYRETAIMGLDLQQDVYLYWLDLDCCLISKHL